MTHAGNKPARSLPEYFARLSDIPMVLSQNESVEHVGFSVKETRRKRDTEADGVSPPLRRGDKDAGDE